MLKNVLIFCLAVFLVACNDVLYQEPVSYEVSGTANVGAPIVGSKVRLFAWRDGEKGELLGESETNGLGFYNVTVQTRFKGPALVEINGGLFIDPMTNVQSNINEGVTLTSPISDLRSKNKANINIWTTLASSRSSGIKSKLEPFNETISKSVALLSEHFGFQINDSEFCNILEDACKEKPDNFLFTFSHAAFHKLAKSNSINSLQMLSVLRDDISDGILDGKMQKEPLFLREGETFNSLFLRRKLASEAHKYFIEKLQSKKMHFDSYKKILSGKNGFYGKISLGNNKNLFPEGVDPIFFDSEPAAPIVLVLLNSPFYDFRNQKDDFGYEGYSFLDRFYFEKNPFWTNGFVFAHMLITNAESKPIEIKIDTGHFGMDYNLNLMKRMHQPIPKNDFNDKEIKELCEVSFRTKTEKMEFENNEHEFISIHFFEYFPREKTIGKELVIQEDNFLRIKPNSYVLVKWYAKPKVNPLLRNSINAKVNGNILNRGIFPPQSTCPSLGHKIFGQHCQKNIDGYHFLNYCKDPGERISEYKYVTVSNLRTTLSTINYTIRLPGQPETEKIRTVDTRTMRIVTR